MQLNLLAIAAALALAATPSATAATIIAYFGADCGGDVIATSDDLNPGECIYLADQESARSMSYSGVPNQISFYESGGAHDACAHGATLILEGSEGCANGPDGFNLESVLIS
ncbi:membrane metallo-endopeptidase [Favolaschia claudopus]|uniref:Membrane metallo-endopeptidase n=1 Tax=Favolaschia claudopus TaxID=2862362 RepID=A0AAW0DX53_9AGAR